MSNLKNFLIQPLQQIPKWIPIVILILALVGFADATYLTVKHYQNVIPPCAIGSCESVLTSKYSEILGVPVSVLGIVDYLVLLVLIFLYFDLKREVFLRTTLFLSTFGFLASLWFTYLQAFVIRAFCQYCLISAMTSFGIFGISLYAIYKSRNN